MDNLVIYQFSDGIATLTMDDGKVNAISVAMLKALNAALDRAEADKAVVIITGRERTFSGGFDLKAFQRDPAEVLQMLEGGARLSQRLLSFQQPVIAACNGHAIAMGVFLLLSTDVRVGVDQLARIQINEVQIGLTLPHFAIEVCRQRLAPAHVNLAALTAHPYTPQEAFAAGFLDELAPPDGLIDAARTQAFRLAKLHGEAFPATKLRLRQPMLQALRQAIERDLAEWNARLLNRS